MVFPMLDLGRGGVGGPVFQEVFQHLIDFARKNFFANGGRKINILHDGCSGFAAKENLPWKKALSQWAVLVTHPPNSPALNAQEFCWANMVKIQNDGPPLYNVKDVLHALPDMFAKATTPHARAGYFRHLTKNCNDIIEWKGAHHAPAKVLPHA